MAFSFKEIKFKFLELIPLLLLFFSCFIKALKSLQEQNLIKRIKQQEIGPKQAYEYSIVFRQDLDMPYIQLLKKQ